MLFDGRSISARFEVCCGGNRARIFDRLRSDGRDEGGAVQLAESERFGDSRAVITPVDCETTVWVKVLSIRRQTAFTGLAIAGRLNPTGQMDRRDDDVDLLLRAEAKRKTGTINEASKTTFGLAFSHSSLQNSGSLLAC